MPQWYIGCSGFHYKEWKNNFYPKGIPEKKWFEYYCTHFNSLELNVTFYRFPKLQHLKSWYERSPEAFVFAVKVPRVITHLKQFKNSQEDIAEFYKLLRLGLNEKLGCVLFQLPPQFSYSVEKLEFILNHIDHSITNVVEFRHVSWWRQDVIETLWEHHVVFCGVSYPGLPDKLILRQPVNYYRFHGVPVLYSSVYNNDFLKHIAEQLNSDQQLQKAFLFFNNTASGAALRNAFFLQEFTGGKQDNVIQEFDF